MITTGCENCCFMKRDDQSRGCGLYQACVIKDDKVVTPGYCRLCRSHKWAKKQNTIILSDLYNKVLDENVLKFDMLVFFDETIHQITDLERTLDSDWYKKYVQKIIIMDVAGFGNRKNLALQYLKGKKHSIPILIDSSVEYEQINQLEQTTYRISKQVTSPFFLVIPAGRVLNNLDSMAKMIQHVPSRAIHWSFPFSIGKTATIRHKLDCGLFITIPYKRLMKSPDTESFTQQLKKEEKEVDMLFSWPCVNCWLE